MQTMKGEVAGFTHLKDLKQILASPGPCISAYISLSTLPNHQGANANSLMWKECIRSLEQNAERYGTQGRELVQSIADWDGLLEGNKPEGRSVAVFRSPDIFRIAPFNAEVKSVAMIGPHFNIRPLLEELTKPKAFYLLALSQKNVRVLRCTTTESEEVPLEGTGAITNFEKYMNPVKPDHNDTYGAATSPVTSSVKGMAVTTSTEREDRDKYLHNFFKQIDRGVNELLRGKTEPLVLAGVEYELTIYREVNSYPHLSEDAARGAPNGLKAGEMHARALEALSRDYEKAVDDALATYNHKVGAGASNRLKDILTAAHDGRVMTLLVSNSLEQIGSFDEATYTVKGRETGSVEDEDLVNDAVVQTILHAGQVFVAPNKKMPNGAPLAAIYRF